ncbi:MAG TPA: GNAT family N-acetyltransferase [Ktedonobacterales bacterium]|nr:GNAT family N-acetyltransferase [Ktedonobacterales bacterium]
MLDPAQIRFRPLQRDDLPWLYAAHLEPHVRQWWDPPASLDALDERFERQQRTHEPPDRYIILYGSVPIGTIQTFPIRSWRDYHTAIQIEEEAAGVDMFIGDRNYLHQGLGGPILRQFLREIVFTNAAFASCIIGPEPENASAIKAYAKAGFRHLKTVQLPFLGEQQYLMRLARSEASDTP